MWSSSSVFSFLWTVLSVYRCMSFCPLSVGQGIVCLSIDGFKLPLWYLKTFLTHPHHNFPHKGDNYPCLVRPLKTSGFFKLFFFHLHRSIHISVKATLVSSKMSGSLQKADRLLKLMLNTTTQLHSLNTDIYW